MKKLSFRRFIIHLYIWRNESHVEHDPCCDTNTYSSRNTPGGSSEPERWAALATALGEQLVGSLIIIQSNYMFKEINENLML